MPAVPRLNGPQVQQSNLPGVRVNTQVGLEAFGGGRGVEAVSQATQGLGNAISKIAYQEKQKADTTAVVEADAKATQLKNTLIFDPENGLVTKKGKDALASVQGFQDTFSKQMAEIADGLSPDQQASFSQRASTHEQELQTQLHRHAFSETEKYKEAVTATSVKAYGDQAVNNFMDPKIIDESIQAQRGVISVQALQDGLGQDVADQQAKSAESKTRAMVIQRMVENGSTPNAQQYLKVYKDRFDANDLLAVENSLKAGRQLDNGMQAWNEVRGFRLGDGTMDEARMQSKIMQSDLSPEDKERTWDFVKSKASEQNQFKAKRDSSNERSFMNSVAGIRQNQQPIEVALRQVDKFALDDYDRNLKTAAVRKLYAPREASNPEAYMALWEKVQDGGIGPRDIDTAFKNDQINVTDWQTLRKDFWNQSIEGKSPEMKQAWDRAGQLAKEKLGDTDATKQFMYDLHASGRGKSPEEIGTMVQDKLKDVKDGSWWGWGSSKQWEMDLKKRDATNTAWGKAYGDVGREQTLAIGTGMSYKTKEAFEPKTIEIFAREFGGYSNIKKGTPANNAMNSLIKNGQLVTPANVKALLEKYPDGNY